MIELTDEILEEHYKRCKPIILKYAQESGAFRALVQGHNGWWDKDRLKGTAKLYYPDDATFDRIIDGLKGKRRSLYWTAQFFAPETANIEKPYDRETGKITEQIGSREDTIYHSFFLDFDKAKDKDIHDPKVVKWLEKGIKFFSDKLTDAGIESFGLAFSGGGCYCVLHPRLGFFGSVGEDNYTYRVEVWQAAFDLLIGDISTEFFDENPEAIEFVKFDKLNYDKKRQVKTILSIHKRFPYAVIPLDKDNPKIDFEEASLPLSDEIIEKANNWLVYQGDIDNFGNFVDPWIQKAKKGVGKIHGTRVVTFETEEISEDEWAPCIRNILAKKDLKSGKGATRALAVLASYLRVVGVSEEKAFKMFKRKADEWNAETSNLFESWYASEPPKCIVPGCENMREKGGGYPHPKLGDLNICTPDERCKGIKGPIEYHKTRAAANADIQLRDREYYLIIDPKPDGTQQYKGVKFKLFATDLTALYHFKTIRDTEEIIYYKDGYYQCNGDREIKEKAEEMFAELISTRGVNEIIGHVMRSTYIDRDELNADATILNFENGLYCLNPNEFRPHTPEHITTMRIPVKYDQDADCPEIKKFLREVVGTENDAKILEEIIGFCLYPRYFIKKAVMLTGEGDNGKTIYLNLIEWFLGKENCSSIVLQKLTLKDRFTNAFLVGMLANIAGDLSSNALSDTGMFKMLTGGDYVPAEIKGGKVFKFLNTAKMLFSANEIPVTPDLTEAFWTRWIIVNFPYTFVSEPKTKHEKKRTSEEELLTKLTTQKEMSGLLNLALGELKRLLDKREFSYGKTTAEIEEEYRMLSSNVYGFVKEWCEETVEGITQKSELYHAYKLYCDWKKKLPESKNMFGRELPRIANVMGVRPKIEGKQVEAWEGILLNNTFFSFVNTIENNNSSNSGNSGDSLYSGSKKNKNSMGGSKEKNTSFATITTSENEQKPTEYATCERCGTEGYLVEYEQQYLCSKCLRDAMQEKRQQPESEHETHLSVREIIKKIEDEFGEEVPVEEVLAHADAEGIDRDKAAEIIDLMKRDGILFSPGKGVVRFVR